ncbi:MAG: sodium:calcium antiporter [Chloroflexi bacterium]|nr:sodium:calcium antiporter [Chloroflexota bacterium]
MALAIVLLIVSIAIILAAAEIFTNAVEWIGKLLNLGEGVVGSILAAVGTAMPETLIPMIAILFVGNESSDEIGIGAILGAPFMLSTAAFFVTGAAVIIFARRGRRTTEMRVNVTILGRDMRFFLIFYTFAIASAFIPVHPVKIAIAFVMLGLYGLYVVRTFADEATESGGDLNPLHFHRHSPFHRHKPDPHLAMALFQFFFALAVIIIGARIFVSNLETVSHDLGVPALILALLIAPLATELPEKFNSVIWVRQGKDTLAMGNISGAMVFQSCIPVAVGLAFTPWELTTPALVSAAIAIVSTTWALISLKRRHYLSPYILTTAGLFYLAFVLYVVVFEV